MREKFWILCHSSVKATCTCLTVSLGPYLRFVPQPSAKC